MTPTLTLNYGVRWELQLPFQPLNDSYSTATLADLCGLSGVGSGPGGRGCNIFQPGVADRQSLRSTCSTDSGNPGYKTDWNNFAPNVGVAWRPNVQGGWLRTLLGDPDQATIRAGFSIAFNRDGWTGSPVFTAATRAPLQRQPEATRATSCRPARAGRSAPPEEPPRPARHFPAAPAYPLTPSLVNGDDINIFDPDIQLPHTQSWTVGFQRALSHDMAIEVRYVGTPQRTAGRPRTGTRSTSSRTASSTSSSSRRPTCARTSRPAAATGDAACTFAYRGPGTGTSPLPIYLAHFARAAAHADDAALYRHHELHQPPGPRLGESNRIRRRRQRPDANATFRANAVTAGLAANFFVMNPDATRRTSTRAVARTYDALQMELRRRLSRGFSESANYTFAKENSTWTPSAATAG